MASVLRITKITIPPHPDRQEVVALLTERHKVLDDEEHELHIMGDRAYCATHTSDVWQVLRQLYGSVHVRCDDWQRAWERTIHGSPTPPFTSNGWSEVIQIAAAQNVNTMRAATVTDMDPLLQPMETAALLVQSGADWRDLQMSVGQCTALIGDAGAQRRCKNKTDPLQTRCWLHRKS